MNPAIDDALLEVKSITTETANLWVDQRLDLKDDWLAVALVSGGARLNSIHYR